MLQYINIDEKLSNDVIATQFYKEISHSHIHI